MNKYRAKRTLVDGRWFHSGAEARRWLELKLLAKAGEITEPELQPRFALHVFGRTEPIGHYIGDFGYFTLTEPRRRVIEDVKGGPIPPLSKWKINHAEAEYNFKVKIVRMGRCRGRGREAK